MVIRKGIGEVFRLLSDVSEWFRGKESLVRSKNREAIDTLRTKEYEISTSPGTG